MSTGFSPFINFQQPSQFPQGGYTSQSLGEEGGNASTAALGEEGGNIYPPGITYDYTGAESGHNGTTTAAIGEEGGPTTMALGEEGGGYPPPPQPDPMNILKQILMFLIQLIMQLIPSSSEQPRQY